LKQAGSDTRRVSEILKALRSAIFRASVLVSNAISEHFAEEYKGDPGMQSARGVIRSLVENIDERMDAGSVESAGRIEELLKMVAELLHDMANGVDSVEAFKLYERKLADNLRDMLMEVLPSAGQAAMGVRPMGMGTMLAPGTDVEAVRYDQARADQAVGIMYEEGINLSGNVRGYIINADSVDNFEDIADLIRVLDARNAAENRGARYRVIFVGRNADAVASRFSALASYKGTLSSCATLGDLNTVLPTVRTGAQVTTTGIVTGKEDEAFQEEMYRVCDNIMLAEEGRIFGKVLVLSLTQQRFMAAFTDAGWDKLNRLAKADAENARKQGIIQKGKKAVIIQSAGTEEADRQIDEALLADLYADTAF
jgi:hypothetical protein